MYIRATFKSKMLMRAVDVRVFLPFHDGYPDTKAPFPTLYFLPGYSANAEEIATCLPLRQMSAKYGIAIVIPDGENSFYSDHPERATLNGSFVEKELVEITRRMFPLSDKREDTFIAGLSMGGFGALRNGLKYSDTFGAAISLSGALDILNVPRTGEDRVLGEAMFGDLKEALLSDKNPRNLIEQLKNAETRPDIYLCCGTEDRLLSQSRTFRTLLEDAGFSVTYEEGPGGHDWDFWDTYIKKIIDWLPLDELSRGRDSGNVD